MHEYNKRRTPTQVGNYVTGIRRQGTEIIVENRSVSGNGEQEDRNDKEPVTDTRPATDKSPRKRFRPFGPPRGSEGCVTQRQRTATTRELSQGRVETDEGRD
jgi:hypothetical protein